ncbi:uncharacterized protein LOC124356601 isoform X1 [Homalodisca vitripennis]|uniref:uncharacterized protein LOC124356601 isoform X1 n=1 Tax=Homalodisca vitripennis TaxID=197043 RepID=UPI001EEB3F38|nr:uncharacterized protein LOC124356601 isoform X1 [Homalodisca vitripennis]
MVLVARVASEALLLVEVVRFTLRTGVMSVANVATMLETVLAIVAADVEGVAGHTAGAGAVPVQGTVAHAAAALHAPGHAIAASPAAPRTAARADPSPDPVPAAGKEASRNPGQTNTPFAVSIVHQSESVWLLGSHLLNVTEDICSSDIPSDAVRSLPLNSPRFKLCLMLSFIRTFLLIVLDLYIAFFPHCVT